MNDIIYQTRALRQLRKIHEEKEIRSKIDTLKDFPNCRNIKHLTDHEYSYRLRVGNYRVFFEFDGQINIISIEEVRKRNERTY